MANTTPIKIFVEKWYRDYLQKKYPTCQISQEKIPLVWNGAGKFECDAVVKKDNLIIEVHCLSCSVLKTKTGKMGIGKLHKIKADILMLTGINCKRKVLAFTDKAMYDKIISAQQNGRLPMDIVLELIRPPDGIRKIITENTRISVSEMDKIFSGVNMVFDDGSSMYSVICPDVREMDLKTITPEILKIISLSVSEKKDMDFCNLRRENLSNRYFDKNGYVYYQSSNSFYRFNLQISALSKL